MTVWHLLSFFGLTLSAWAGVQAARDFSGKPDRQEGPSLQDFYLRLQARVLLLFTLAVLVGVELYGLSRDGLQAAVGYLPLMAFYSAAWFAWSMGAVAVSSLLLGLLEKRASLRAIQTTAGFLGPLSLLAVFVPMLSR